MAELKLAFEEMGCRDVKTVLATGNVRFEVKTRSATALTKAIETKLATTFGFQIRAIVRTLDYVEKLIKAEPFKRIKVTPQTRLYVTFLSEQPATKLKIPYESPDKHFRILKVSENEVFHAVVLTPNSRSVDSMAILEKEFGKDITTRNWNTISRIVNH